MERTLRIMFQKAGKYIDICFTGGDYGFQSGPMMSQRMFDESGRTCSESQPSVSA